MAAEQPVLASELEPVGPRPLGQLTKDLLVSRRQPGLAFALLRGHVGHLVSPPSRGLHR